MQKKFIKKKLRLLKKNKNKKTLLELREAYNMLLEIDEDNF
jgi:hypothetical protein